MTKIIKSQSSKPCIRDLMARVDKENPSREDVAALRELLKSDPALVAANDLTEKAFTRVFESASSSNAMRELLAVQLKEKRNTFGYQEANAFVKMLIDQVIICQIRLNNLEMIHTSRLGGTHSSEQGIYWDKRLNFAQRRFLKACETLAKVKKILAELELKEVRAREKSSQNAASSLRICRGMGN